MKSAGRELMRNIHVDHTLLQEKMTLHILGLSEYLIYLKVFHFFVYLIIFPFPRIVDYIRKLTNVFFPELKSVSDQTLFSEMP